MSAPVSVWAAGEGTHRVGWTLSSFLVADGQPAEVLGLLDEDSALADRLLHAVPAAGIPLAVNLLGWPHRGLADAFAQLAPRPAGRSPSASGATAPGVRCWTTRRLDRRPGAPSPDHAGWALLVRATVEHVELGPEPADGMLGHVRGRYRADRPGADRPAYPQPMTTVLLIRHGRTSANTAGILAGRSSGRHARQNGTEQVAEVGRRMAGVPLKAVVTSPLRRCRQTAQALIAARTDDCPLTVDAGLVECGYGEWTGKTLREVSKEKLWGRCSTSRPRCVSRAVRRWGRCRPGPWARSAAGTEAGGRARAGRGLGGGLPR